MSMFADMRLTFLNLRMVEGTSLTVLGMFTYDAEAGNFSATELGGFLAGGVQEFKAILEKKLLMSGEMRSYLTRILGFCIGVGVVATYLGTQRWVKKLYRSTKKKLLQAGRPP